MAEDSKIEWTTHTWNPWEGCVKVSPGCKNCYAEARDLRFTGGKYWGPNSTRRVISEKLAREPLRWQKAAAQKNAELAVLNLPPQRPRVFCASLADVFEDRPDLTERRGRVFDMIRQCPDLDWLLLTKRPENIARLWPKHVPPPSSSEWPNVWLGCTAEDQEWADKRIPHLLAVPAVVHFVSLEPLLGPVSLARALGAAHLYARTPRAALDWAIIGGESGHNARPFELEWARSLLAECDRMLIAPFVKQLGACASDPENGIAGHALKVHPDAAALVSRRLADPKGGDMSEWPLELRVREFPKVGGFPK